MTSYVMPTILLWLTIFHLATITTGNRVAQGGRVVVFLFRDNIGYKYGKD